MKIPVTKIIDPETQIPINSEMHRIEQIKKEISSCQNDPEFCQVEVFDMWDDAA